MINIYKIIRITCFRTKLFSLGSTAVAKQMPQTLNGLYWEKVVIIKEATSGWDTREASRMNAAL